ncbi:hypothetical protein FXO37_33431 [Capsicum annuum]|nr:hypothetical protein FXO37_33431 [Capsicum annuum]
MGMTIDQKYINELIHVIEFLLRSSFDRIQAQNSEISSISLSLFCYDFFSGSSVSSLVRGIWGFCSSQPVHRDQFLASIPFSTSCLELDSLLRTISGFLGNFSFNPLWDLMKASRLIHAFNWESQKYDWWRNLDGKGLYSLNSSYGSEHLLKSLLSKMKHYKVRGMADIVINHRVGTTKGHGGMYNRYDGIPFSWDEHAVTSCTGGLDLLDTKLVDTDYSTTYGIPIEASFALHHHRLFFSPFSCIFVGRVCPFTGKKSSRIDQIEIRVEALDGVNSRHSDTHEDSKLCLTTMVARRGDGQNGIPVAYHDNPASC